MQKKIRLFIAVLIFALVGLASAHPLGNFSINQFSQIEIGKSQVKLRSVLDLAEIPTFQESQTIDIDKDGKLSQEELNSYAETVSPGYIANLKVSIDDQPVELRPTAKNIYLEEGSGNLPILKIKWDLVGDLPSLDANAIHRFKFENKNHPERVGWNEIVVGHVSGINIFNSTAFGSGITEELSRYPGESLTAPLAERAAEFSFISGSIPQNVKALQNRDGQTTAPIEKDKFAELIKGEITPSVVLLGLLLAFGLGAAHALSPGHGKAVVGAYLVGSRGTFKHAVFLGATVTITHTLGVFAIGLLTLFASNYILPETLMPFLNFVSGLLVFLIGLALFKDRLFAALGWNANSHNHESATHSLDEHAFLAREEDAVTPNPTPKVLTHTHGGSTHTHLPPKDVTWSSLLGLGISGGLLPCPSALVLMLSAISLNRIGYGIVLTLVFSFGLAATLTAVGLAFLYVGKLFDNPKLNDNPIFKALPVFSAFVITCVGAIICYNSLI
jgi:ABC-type nickel/cobalt efflux system permease component RcnA